MRDTFDCFDFCEWTMGKPYNLSKFIVPWGVVLLPTDLETLIDEHQS